MKASIIFTILLALGTFVFSSSASAHGSTKALHGGVVKIEHEMVFELVRENAATTLYLRDHGKPYPTNKVTGNITVLANGEKSDTTFKHAGDNKMVANISIPDGAKVLVKIKDQGHHSVTVRYTF
ncbi:hypothetical protein [Pseudoalteromonas luteoviolacea]|uniref:hypothetical protein n=1 Tax=Pseudoalteromonas luteoviolacea TaxID=43657 RepID=UPI001153ECDD|nr:hypothetical protein [Pseudoalteromonas luteoviolacea]TQF67502.1 hypothetical protein FLM44_20160 [Pseudoalteromonas luteoviolacea]